MRRLTMDKSIQPDMCPVWSKVNSHCDGKMYGILLESIQYFVTSDVGEDLWKKILIDAGVKGMIFETHTAYKDEIMINLAKSCHKVTRMKSFNEWMMFFGRCFVEFCSNYGYDKLFRVAGRNYRDFLYEINNIHETIRFSYPRLRSPSFLVLHEDKEGCVLLYQSYRHGFKHYVIGQLTRCAEKFYNVKVTATIVDEVIVDQMCHVKFRLDFDNSVYVQPQTNICSGKQPKFSSISGDTFLKVFPFCIVFDKSLTICNVGRSLAALLQGANEKETGAIGCKLLDKFRVLRPSTACSWDKILRFNHVIFLVEYICDEQPKSGLNNSQTPECSQRPTQCPFTELLCKEEQFQHSCENDSQLEEVSQSAPCQSKCSVNLKLNDGTEISPEIDHTVGADNLSSQTNEERRVLLRGEMKYIKNWERVAFLCAPLLNNMGDLQKLGLYINDLSMFDHSRDMVLAGCQHASRLERSIEQQREQIDQITDVMAQTDDYIAECDKILYRMIPKAIALKLKAGVRFVETCETFDNVTIMFMYMVDFSEICDRCEPMEIVTCINKVFSFFDNIIEDYNVFKVETLGDAVYMVAGGVPDRNPNHASNVAELALELQEQAKVLKSPLSKDELQTRIGMHTGNVVGGVVGTSTPQYCLFGDTVNTAARMQTHSVPGRIHISESCNTMLQGTEYVTVYRGSIFVKSKGRMNTYWLAGKEGEEKTRRRVQQFELERSLAEVKPALANPRPSSKDELDLHGMHESTSYAQLDLTASQEATRPDLPGLGVVSRLEQRFSPRHEHVSAEILSDTNTEKRVGCTLSDTIVEKESTVKFFIQKEEYTTATLTTDPQSLTTPMPVDLASSPVDVDALGSLNVAGHKHDSGNELQAIGLELTGSVKEQAVPASAVKERKVTASSVKDPDLVVPASTVKEQVGKSDAVGKQVGTAEKEQVITADGVKEQTLTAESDEVKEQVEKTDAVGKQVVNADAVKEQVVAADAANVQAVTSGSVKEVVIADDVMEQVVMGKLLQPDIVSICNCDQNFNTTICQQCETINSSENVKGPAKLKDIKLQVDSCLIQSTEANVDTYNAAHLVCHKQVTEHVAAEPNNQVLQDKTEKLVTAEKNEHKKEELIDHEGLPHNKGCDIIVAPFACLKAVDGKTNHDNQEICEMDTNNVFNIQIVCDVSDENQNNAKSAIKSQKQNQDYDDEIKERKILHNKHKYHFTVQNNEAKMRMMANEKIVEKPEFPISIQQISVSDNDNSNLLDDHLTYGKAKHQKDYQRALEAASSHAIGCEYAINVDLQESVTVDAMKCDKNTKHNGETANVFEKAKKKTELQNERVDSNPNNRGKQHGKPVTCQMELECHKQNADYIESKEEKRRLGNQHGKHITAEIGKEKRMSDKDPLDTKTNGMVFSDSLLTCVQTVTMEGNDRNKFAADKTMEGQVFSVDSNNTVMQKLNSNSKAIHREEYGPASQKSHVKDDEADSKHGRKNYGLNGCSSISRLFNCHSMKDRFSKLPAKLCDKHKNSAKLREKDTIVTNGENNVTTIVCKERHTNVCITSTAERKRNQPNHKSALISTLSNSFSHRHHQRSNVGLYQEIFHRNTDFMEQDTPFTEQSNGIITGFDEETEILTAENRLLSGQRAVNNASVSKTDRLTVHDSIRKRCDEQRPNAASEGEGNVENGIKIDFEHETEVHLETMCDEYQLEKLKYVPMCRSNCTSLKREKKTVYQLPKYS